MSFVVAAACTTPAPPPTVAPTIITDREEYRATVDTMFTSLTIGFRYTNPGPDTAYIPVCQRAYPPIVEKWIGSAWTIVYNQPVALCAGPPLVVAPGRSVTDTLRLMGARPGRNYRPTFDAASVPGHYRLLWDVTAGPARVPIEKRTSNVFRVIE